MKGIAIIAVIIGHTTKIKQILSWIGRNSLAVLCIHFLEMHTPIWQYIGLPQVWFITVICKVLFILSIVFFLSHINVFCAIFVIKPIQKKSI